MKNTAGEIRAAVMQIEQDGGMPIGLLQSLYENNTGYRDEQTALPKHKQSGQAKEQEILDAGLRLQEKLTEFEGNPILAAHAFNYGDKRTTEALQSGFNQEEIDNTYAIMARMGKYGGEPLSDNSVMAMSQTIGVPSKDLSGAVQAKPPKPQIPKPQGISTLRSAIFGGESGGNYNIVNRGKRHGYGAGQVDLTNKTINQVLAEQDRGDYKAAGAYQIIPGTLRAAKKAMGLSGNEQFTPQLQDRIFADYLAKTKRPPLRDYIMGKSNNLKAAHTALAQEWASVDRGDGLSYYHGDGVNKAHIPLQKSINAVQDMRNQYQANIQSGMNEDEAYRAALVGGGDTSMAMAGASQPAYSGYTAPQQAIAQPQATEQIATAEVTENSTNEMNNNITEAVVEIAKTDWQGLAKKAFKTKKESYVPKYVSQAVRGVIKGV